MKTTLPILRRIIQEAILHEAQMIDYGKEIKYHSFNVDQSIAIFEKNGVYTVKTDGIAGDDMWDNTHYDIKSEEEALELFNASVAELDPRYADHDLYREKQGSIPRHSYGSRSALARPRY